MVKRSSALVLLLLAGCSTLDGQPGPYVWPPVDPREAASPAPVTSFTVRYSEWLNDSAQLQRLVAERCGPKFGSASLFHYPDTTVPLHAQDYVVYCGGLKLRPRVYPETGALSENLQQLNYPVEQGEPGTVIRWR